MRVKAGTRDDRDDEDDRGEHGEAGAAARRRGRRDLGRRLGGRGGFLRSGDGWHDYFLLLLGVRTDGVGSMPRIKISMVPSNCASDE